MNLHKNKKFVSSLLIALMLILCVEFIPCDYNLAKANTDYKIQPLQGKIVSVPIGTVIPAKVTGELSSEYMTIGQSVCVSLSQNFYYNNTLVAPLGSTINGTVILAKKAGRAGTNGQFMIKFTNIFTPYGQMIPISGKIQTEDNTGIIAGGTKIDTAKDYAKDIAIGTGAGALLGVTMGAASDGKAGKGAAIGSVIGAGIGLAKSLADKGENAIIPVGSDLNIVLDQQATFTPIQGYQY